MPGLDKLEIVTPDGKIHFYDLDPLKGVTTIGQHAEFDIVIGDPQRDTFQVVLDHEKKPFRVMTLGTGADVRLGGQPLIPNSFQEFRDWQTLELDGYCLTLLENVELPLADSLPAFSAPAAPQLAQLPLKPVGQTVGQPEEGIELPAPVAEALPAAALMSSALRVRPPDLKDDLIITSLSAQDW